MWLGLFYMANTQLEKKNKHKNYKHSKGSTKVHSLKLLLGSVWDITIFRVTKLIIVLDHLKNNNNL